MRLNSQMEESVGTLSAIGTKMHHNNKVYSNPVRVNFVHCNWIWG